MKRKMVLGRKMWNIFSIHAPQVERPEQEKEISGKNLKIESDRYQSHRSYLLAAIQIGSENTGYEKVMGNYGYGAKNNEGETVLRICQNHKLRILNTYFKKKVEKLIHIQMVIIAHR